jgi:hypothetical protein
VSSKHVITLDATVKLTVTFPPSFYNTHIFSSANADPTSSWNEIATIDGCQVDVEYRHWPIAFLMLW